MQTEFLKLTQIELNDITDWLNPFNPNMQIIDTFAKNLHTQTQSLIQSVQNQNAQIENITNETKNLQTNVTDFSEQLNSMNQLLTEVNIHLNELSSFLTVKNNILSNPTDWIQTINYAIFGKMISIRIMTNANLSTGTYIYTIPEFFKPYNIVYPTSYYFNDNYMYIDEGEMRMIKNGNNTSVDYFYACYIYNS